MSVIRDLWRFLTPAQRLRVLGAQAISVLMALSTVAGIAAITPFFAVLGDPTRIDHSPALAWLFGHLAFEDKRRFVEALGAAFVGIVVLTNLLNLLGTYVVLRIAQGIGDDLRLVLFSSYLRRDYIFHTDANGAALVNNIAYETERSAVTALQSGFALVTSVLTAVFIISSILYVNPIAALAVIAALVGGYFLIYLSLRQRISRAGKIESQLLAQRMKLIVEALGAVKEIIVLQRQDFFERRFERSSLGLARLAAYIDAITHSPKYIMECIAAGGLVGAALVSSGTGGGTGAWLAQLTFLGFAVYRLLPSLQQAFAGVVKIRAASAGFASIAPDLVRPRNVPTEPDEFHGSPMAPKWELRLSHVGFRYGAATAPALHDVSLHIVPGTMVGLVGANGCGKTTLVDILSGLLSPDCGHVYIDGVRLDSGNRAAWQSRIAYVPQNIYLLDSSIAENIALGVAAGSIDAARMAASARLARLDEFIGTLPNGYREIIGERGVRLSGGQRQRLGIARALYTTASVLIMDEATSALDASAEAAVMAAVEGLRGTLTIILIAHRMNSLRHCDRIFELDRGTILRTGTWGDFAARPASMGSPVGT